MAPTFDSRLVVVEERDNIMHDMANLLLFNCILDN